jgi:hypothetical protein
VLVGILAADPTLVATRPGQTLIADKHYYGRQFQAALAAWGVRLLRPARKGEPPRAGAQLFRPLRQVIESINQTFKGQLDLERHGGHTPTGVVVRVLQRILALTAAIWHNDHTGQPTARSCSPTTTNNPVGIDHLGGDQPAPRSRPRWSKDVGAAASQARAPKIAPGGRR